MKHWLACFVTGLAFLATTQRASAEEPSSDSGRIRTGLVVAGSATLAVGYAGSAYVAARSASPYSDWGYVPLVGAPIMALRTKAECDENNGGYDDSVGTYCDGVPVIMVFSVISTFVQVAGG